MLNRINQTTDKVGSDTPTQLPVVVTNLCYVQNARPLLSDITFSLLPNMKSVIMGPNGAGKSLLLRALHGLIAPTSGTITWAGKPANAEIRKRQAMVFQKPVLLRRSTHDNIAFVLRHLPSDLRISRIDELLEMSRLRSHAGTPARLLSGGEQQRLSIARALALKPQVLFLDEPTASLDPSATQAVEDLITAAHVASTKVVLVTHDIGQAKRIADEILFLDHGRLAESGTASTFFTEPKSRAARAYLAGQLYLE